MMSMIRARGYAAALRHDATELGLARHVAFLDWRDDVPDLLSKLTFC